jgi:SAM-dependent methyltransferase
MVNVPSLDYDRIAREYDARYRHNRYLGIERALTGFAANAPGLRVLEVGCGTGFWLEFLETRGARVTGLDRSRQMLAVARTRGLAATLAQGAAESIPFADRSFDRVIVVNAAHHFDDLAAFVREAHRVLVPDGELMSIGLDPSRGTDRWYVYDCFDGTLESDLRRYPSAESVTARMVEAGFARCRVVEAEHLSIEMDAKKALADGQLARSATSQLTLLSDDAYQRGLKRIERDVLDAEARGEVHALRADLRLYAIIGEMRA